MSAPVLNGPFVLPMFRSFVPRKMQPWIYLFIAVTFQLSGGVYLGALNQMIGSMSLMREDILMCMYANLAGMAIYFPLLFRMKFRFTNKTLLTSAALGVLLCNLIAPHITFLPLLWLVCFIEGMCKIQGTFECMSNIQLWMTPKREFTVFFPWLHIVILGSIQLSDLITTRLMYHYHWTYMNLFVAGLMLIVLLIQFTCVKHFRFMRKFPLFGIDWLGGILWAALLAEIAFLFNYGDWYDWWNSPVIRQLTIVIFITLGICIWRMMTIRHPFLEPKMWTYRHFLPLLGLVTLVEAFLATEHVLEEVFYEEVMKYEELVSSQLDWLAIVGIVCGCVFSYWWMHVKQYNYVRLVIVGFIGLNRLPDRFLPDFIHRHPYFTALPADRMSGLRLCRIECYFYGVSGGNYDFPAFLPGIKCVQYAAHGSRRRSGSRSLCTGIGVLCSRQSGPLRFSHRSCSFQQ